MDDSQSKKASLLQCSLFYSWEGSYRSSVYQPQTQPCDNRPHRTVVVWNEQSNMQRASASLMRICSQSSLKSRHWMPPMNLYPYSITRLLPSTIAIFHSDINN